MVSKKQYNKLVKDWAKNLFDSYDDIVGEAMADYGEEAAWKIDKFLPEYREELETIMDNAPREIKDKKEFAVDVLDKAMALISKYIEKHWEEYYRGNF